MHKTQMPSLLTLQPQYHRDILL